MKNGQKLVTIARFENGFEAQLAKVSLDEAGIHAVILGESLGTAFPDLSKIDYVELQVFEEDRMRAEQWLAENMISENEEEPEEDFE